MVCFYLFIVVVIKLIRERVLGNYFIIFYFVVWWDILVGTRAYSCTLGSEIFLKSNVNVRLLACTAIWHKHQIEFYFNRSKKTV